MDKIVLWFIYYFFFAGFKCILFSAPCSPSECYNVDPVYELSVSGVNI